jgi:transformation/transcription domain-associated protein
VKTLSFLTYVFRGFAKRVEPHRDALAACAIHLLVACPADVISTRKELLIAIRHIIATDFRYGFLKKMDYLLDENIMTEFSRTQDLQRIAPCRQLAYSVLADSIHHFRSELTVIIHAVLYSSPRCLHTH